MPIYPDRSIQTEETSFVLFCFECALLSLPTKFDRVLAAQSVGQNELKYVTLPKQNTVIFELA